MMEAVKTKPYWTPRTSWEYLRDIGVELARRSNEVGYLLKIEHCLMDHPQNVHLHTRFTKASWLNVYIRRLGFEGRYSANPHLKEGDTPEIPTGTYKGKTLHQRRWESTLRLPMYHPKRFWKHSPDRFSKANDLERQRLRERKKKKVI